MESFSTVVIVAMVVAFALSPLIMCLFIAGGTVVATTKFVIDVNADSKK